MTSAGPRSTERGELPNVNARRIRERRGVEPAVDVRSLAGNSGSPTRFGRIGPAGNAFVRFGGGHDRERRAGLRGLAARRSAIRQAARRRSACPRERRHLVQDGDHEMMRDVARAAGPVGLAIVLRPCSCRRAVLVRRLRRRPDTATRCSAPAARSRRRSASARGRRRRDSSELPIDGLISVTLLNCGNGRTRLRVAGARSAAAGTWLSEMSLPVR